MAGGANSSPTSAMAKVRWRLILVASSKSIFMLIGSRSLSGREMGLMKIDLPLCIVNRQCSNLLKPALTADSCYSIEQILLFRHCADQCIRAETCVVQRTLLRLIESDGCCSSDPLLNEKEPNGSPRADREASLFGTPESPGQGKGGDHLRMLLLALLTWFVVGEDT